MKLLFVDKFLSIDKAEPIEIPDFTVLTGVNGAGKSHLLHALENRAVKVEGLVHPSKLELASPTVVRLDQGSFRIGPEKLVGTNEFVPIYEELKGLLGAPGESIVDVLTPSKELYGACAPYLAQKKTKLWGLRVEDERVQEMLDDYKRNVEHGEIFSSPTQSHKMIYEAVKRLPCFFCDMQSDAFIKYCYVDEEKQSVLPGSLGKVFLDYHSKYELNRYLRFLNEVDNLDVGYISDDVFFEAYGPKPWVVLNKALESVAGLRYKVNFPSPIASDSFHLQLFSLDDEGLAIDFDSLSSGEATLMALVAILYRVSLDKEFPQLILFDEIDAALHPSMIKSLFEVLKDISLDGRVKIIMVTHSPTTIALAPTGSICLMERKGVPRIRKVKAEEALAILSEGFLTLDEGLRFFDSISENKISIISEGRNINYIERALELFGVEGVRVIKGIEAITSKSQMNSMYKFFTKVDHKNKVLFIWDCDAHECAKLVMENGAYPYVFEQNKENLKCSKGIENLFSEELINEFLQRQLEPAAGLRGYLRDDDKKLFEVMVMERNDIKDFKLFEGVIDWVKAIKDAKG